MVFESKLSIEVESQPPDGRRGEDGDRFAVEVGFEAGVSFFVTFSP